MAKAPAKRRVDLVRALKHRRRVKDVKDDAWTMREAREQWGVGKDKALELIREMIAAGEVESVQVPRRDITGRRSKVYAYRFVK